MTKMVKSKQSNKSKQTTPSAASCRKFKGVRMRSWGSWVSEIRAPNQKTRIWLGSYSTAEAAARAYDAALLCLKGSSASANLNFPNASKHYIPSDTIMSPKSIQKLAAAAAAVDDSSAPEPPSSPSSSISLPLSEQLDDELTDSLGTGITVFDPDQTYKPSMHSFESSWYSFDSLESPKYVDHIFNSAFTCSPPVTDDFFEEGDISLWSFC